MKVIYDPLTFSNLASINASFVSGYPLSNATSIRPSVATRFTYKMTYVGLYSTLSFIHPNLSGVKLGAFVNRFNFANIKFLSSKYASPEDDLTYISSITGLTKDEIYDENYMHYFHEFQTNHSESNSYFHVIVDGDQDQLFDKSYYELGNVIVGQVVELPNPKNGLMIDYEGTENEQTFDSGYSDTKLTGKTRRKFTGSFDRISEEEYNKLRYTKSPFVIYLDWTNDPSYCYLVRSSKNFQKSFTKSQVTSHEFEFTELV